MLLTGCLRMVNGALDRPVQIELDKEHKGQQDIAK